MRSIALAVLLVLLTSCHSNSKSSETKSTAQQSNLPVRLGDNSHYQGANQHRDRVIVFVHGIYGSAGTTWDCPEGKTSWPELMAADDTFSKSDIYVVDYPSPKTGNMMSINDEVSHIMSHATSDGVFEHKEIVFLVHSLGGLITQRLLLTHRDIAAKTKFIYFFSTPEEGAQIAQIGHLFNDDPLLHQMFVGDNNVTLDDIERDWTNAKFEIPRYCAYERKPTHGVVVVDRLSGTRLCNRDPIAIYANHNEIVEPCNIKNDSYIAFKNAYVENPVMKVVSVPRPWSQSQNVDCNRTNRNDGLVASVTLNPQFRETVDGPVDVQLVSQVNIKDPVIRLISQSGNTATIAYSFNGLDAGVFGCPGGGHATILATFPIRQEIPE